MHCFVVKNFQFATILPIRCIPGINHVPTPEKIDHQTVNDLVARIDGNEALLRGLYDLKYLDSYKKNAGFKQAVINYKKICENVSVLLCIS